MQLLEYHGKQLLDHAGVPISLVLGAALTCYKRVAKAQPETRSYWENHGR